eukprot:6175402-Pleurochrysis_carterae.AAC.2
MRLVLFPPPLIAARAGSILQTKRSSQKISLEQNSEAVEAPPQRLHKRNERQEARASTRSCSACTRAAYRSRRTRTRESRQAPETQSSAKDNPFWSHKSSKQKALRHRIRQSAPQGVGTVARTALVRARVSSVVC